jgi:hypothetical protein
MTSVVDIANKALQAIGIQKRISSLAQDSAEAQAINLVFTDLRDDLLRMAPWSGAQKTANLVYITSSPGTPENQTAATTLWQPGQPPPPWNYEYQYPADCLRALWLIPATQTGFAGGIPITTAVTGGAASFWQGPPVKFQVMADQFYPVTAAAVASGGTGNAIGDVLTLATTPNGSPPIGAPVQLLVTSVTGGVVTGVSVVNVLNGAGSSNNNQTEVVGGSYFSAQSNPVGVSASTGAGTGATFNLTFGPQAPQRVIVTNQEYATMTYIQQLVDPNVMDTLFQRAWINLIAAHIALQIKDDRQLANDRIQIANMAIAEARKTDGNEGLTVNDVTPDWIRIRGIDFVSPYSGPFSGVDWGSMWPVFG